MNRRKSPGKEIIEKEAVFRKRLFLMLAVGAIFAIAGMIYHVVTSEREKTEFRITKTECLASTGEFLGRVSLGNITVNCRVLRTMQLNPGEKRYYECVNEESVNATLQQLRCKSIGECGVDHYWWDFLREGNFTREVGFSIDIYKREGSVCELNWEQSGAGSAVVPELWKDRSWRFGYSNTSKELLESCANTVCFAVGSFENFEVWRMKAIPKGKTTDELCQYLRAQDSRSIERTAEILDQRCRVINPARREPSESDSMTIGEADCPDGECSIIFGLDAKAWLCDFSCEGEKR